MFDEEKGVGDTEETQEEVEVESGVEEEETEEQEAEVEAIPKHRYDKLLQRTKDSEAKLQHAIDWINKYATQTQPRQQPTVEEKLSQLEQAYVQLQSQINANVAKEQETANLVSEVESVIEANPHLREWSQEIYRAIAWDPDRTADDVAKELNTKLKKLGSTAVSNAITSKKKMAGHKTAGSIGGSPKTSVQDAKQEALSKVKSWDDVEDYIASSVRTTRSAREGT